MQPHIFELLEKASDTQLPAWKHLFAIVGFVCVLLGLGCFLWSIGLAVGVSRKDPEQVGFASRKLHPPTSEDATLLADATIEGARQTAFSLTIDAARTLMLHNQDVEKRL